ncbi:MAG: TauD/TfdA family dioxygenase [Proteobacteria bacterium]|nr:TauD/TfdA family dioxygenase [Pseudomonadota bacterium]
MTTTRHPITGPSAWRGQDLAGAEDWITPLPAGAADEIHTALQGVAGRPWRDITRDDFRLPDFTKTLAELAHELEHGRGFVRLRGLPVERYDEDDLRKLLWGIGAHLGTPRYQNGRGELIGEVRDELRAYGAVREAHQSGVDGRPVSSRYKTRTNGPLRFHTDRCDVIALLCVRAPRSGGASRLVSAVAIHNEILARRPDLLEALYGDYYRSRTGEEAGGEAATYALPVFAVQDGHFTTQYSRTFVEAAQAVDGIPPLTDVQTEALDLLHEVADELCLEAAFETGDLLLINNHVTYHARGAFEDDETGEGRLLLRLWLAMPNSRPLPAGHEILWGAVEPGALRGGIAQPG